MSTGGANKIADALVLCLTRGMSLKAWSDAGVLGREWALYERLAPHYNRLVVVSYAIKGEREVASRLGAETVFNESGAPHEAYVQALPALAAAKLRTLGATSAVVKTNQFEGGDAAVAVTAALRSANIRTALIARGGYPWSRFEAWKHGTDSPQAARAAAEEGDLCRAADAVIGTTPGMVEDLAWRYALPKRRLHIVPNYVVAHPAAPTAAPKPDSRPVVLAAGRLEPQKRFDMLVHAVAESGIADRALLRIVGRGPLSDDLRKQAEREGVSLELIPSLPHADLVARMRSCTMFVQCSAYEGHPKAVLEAMAAGACVLVTDTPGLADVVVHGTSGWVSPDSEPGLADAIKELMDSPAQRQRLGQTARGMTAPAFDVDRVTQDELRVHARATAESQAQPRHGPPLSAVRWDPALLSAPRAEQTDAFRASLNGFARRLAPKDRAAFLLSLDDPIYQLQGPAAIHAESQPGGSGLHPKHRLMRYHDFFVDRIKPGERVIDLGSGVGALAASIAQRSHATVLGVEIEPTNIAKAEHIAEQQGLRGRIAFICGDITTHRAEGTFGAVVLSNVLEHIKDRPAMLRRWAQWYKPSRFLIRVPAFDRDWKVPFKKELGIEWRLDDTHELEYTERTLDAELREAGLEITESVVRWGEYWVVARPVPAPSDWARVRMLVFDFDGVMSNNQVLVMQDATEGVLCNRSDGMGIDMLRRAAPEGFSMLVLSKEVNPVVAARCRKLNLECHQGVDDKLPALRRMASERAVTADQIAYVGNDINDVACMGWAGLPVAVADAFPACKAAARFVTTAPGGHGAVREVCERIIAAWQAPKA